MFRPFSTPRRPINLIKLDKLTGEIVWCRDIRGGDLRGEWTGVEVHAYPDSDSHDVAVLLTATFPTHGFNDHQRVCHFEVDAIVGHPSYPPGVGGILPIGGIPSAVGTRKLVCTGTTAERGIWQRSETGEWLRAPDFCHGSQIPPRCTIGLPQLDGNNMYAVELTSDPPAELGVDPMTFVGFGKIASLGDSTSNLPTQVLARVDGSGETVWRYQHLGHRHDFDSLAENGAFNGFDLVSATAVALSRGHTEFDPPTFRNLTSQGEQSDSLPIISTSDFQALLSSGDYVVSSKGNDIGGIDVYAVDDDCALLWNMSDHHLEYQSHTLTPIVSGPPITIPIPFFHTSVQQYHGRFGGDRLLCDYDCYVAWTNPVGDPSYPSTPARVRGICVRDTSVSAQPIVSQYHEHVTGSDVPWVGGEGNSWSTVTSCHAANRVVAWRRSIGYPLGTVWAPPGPVRDGLIAAGMCDTDGWYYAWPGYGPLLAIATYNVDAQGSGATGHDKISEQTHRLTAWDDTLTTQLWSVTVDWTDSIDQLVGDDDCCIAISQDGGARRYDPDTGDILWSRDTSNFPGEFFRPHSAALSGRYLYLAGSNDRRP